MADDLNMQGGKNVIIFAVIVIFFNFLFWGNFISQMNHYYKEFPGVCVNGRQLGENTSQAHFLVDEELYSPTERFTEVTYACRSPIAVYPCLDANVDPSDWQGECRNIAEVPLLTYKTHSFMSGLSCTWNGPDPDTDCDKKQWDCASGTNCTVVEKAGEVCAQLFSKDPYPCYYEWSATEKVTVRTTHTEYALDWLVFALLFFFFLALSVVGCCVAVSSARDCGRKFATVLAVAALGHGLWMLLVFLIFHIKGSEPEPVGASSTAHWLFGGVLLDRRGGIGTPSPLEPPDAPLTQPRLTKTFFLLFGIVTCGAAFVALLQAGCIALQDHGRRLQSEGHSGDDREGSEEERSGLTGARSAPPREGGPSSGAEDTEDAVERCSSVGSDSRKFDGIAVAVLEEAEATREFVQQVGGILYGIIERALPLPSWVSPEVEGAEADVEEGRGGGGHDGGEEPLQHDPPVDTPGSLPPASTALTALPP